MLASDPDVEQAGVDAGYSPNEGILRAADVVVGNVPSAPGWIKGAPPLAVEYADTGQNEDDLQDKIAELLEAGTKYLWVVRLTGTRRVEVHEPGKDMRIVLPGEELLAPGVLRNPVRVEALYDPGAAMEATLRNLLQRQGYDSLEQVRAEGHAEALEHAARKMVASGISVEQTAAVLEVDVSMVREALGRCVEPPEE